MSLIYRAMPNGYLSGMLNISSYNSRGCDEMKPIRVSAEALTCT